MQLLLFLLYTSILMFVVLKMPFFRNTSLKPRLLLGLFALKIAMATAYGYIHFHYFYGGDTWAFLQNSRLIYESLFINPLYYLELTFLPNARTPPDYLYDIIYPIAGWNDVRTYTIYRINAILHLISGGYYYVHAVFFAFFSYVGSIALYRTFANYFPERGKRMLIVLFAVPTIVFWSSGIHKEAVTLFCLGLIFYHFQQLLYKNKIKKRIVFLLPLLFLLSITRPHVCMILMPMLLIWAWTDAKPKHTFLKIIAVYVVGITAITLVSYISPKVNIFAKIHDMRWYFVVYNIGSSEIWVKTFEPNLLGAIKNIPSALHNMTTYPRLWESKTIFHYFASAELIVLWLFFVLTLRFNSWKSLENKHFLYACLFFVFSFLIFMGLIVDNIGAIVRYRSVVLPFLLGVLVIVFDEKKIGF